VASSDSTQSLGKSILCTAIIEVSSDNGSRTVALLFDEGAEVYFISSMLARTIYADLRPCDLRVEGVGSATVICKYVTDIQLDSIHRSSTALTTLNFSAALLESDAIVVTCQVVDHTLNVNSGWDSVSLHCLMKDYKLTLWQTPALADLCVFMSFSVAEMPIGPT